MKPTYWMGNVGSRIGTSTTRKLLLVCAGLIVALPASAGGRGFWGGYGFGYGPAFYGPAFGPWGYYGYDPFFYGAYPMITHPNAGQVKLDTKVKDAEVFIDGSLAGMVGDLKSLWLYQGSYNLEVRSPGREPFTARIFVVNGKTVHVHPDLRVEPKP